jgi:hypothetical protein
LNFFVDFYPTINLLVRDTGSPLCNLIYEDLFFLLKNKTRLAVERVRPVRALSFVAELQIWVDKRGYGGCARKERLGWRK